MNRWHRFLPGKRVDEDLYNRFKCSAEALTVTVLRAVSQEDAAHLISEQIKQMNIQKVVSTPLNLVNIKTLEEYAHSLDLDFSQQLDQGKIEQADMGISEFEMGIAQLGCIFQDASDLHRRLVSMLPPVHLALLRTSSLVDSFVDALEIIEKVYNGQMPPFLSFITGPSKTADIERELTIGVHGPENLVVLFIDKE
ncbi:MAG: lactate utilization protein [Candidatus Aminicenantes bacterium]|nr:lactate utilization protein [Candidatus Aminicenantes bacterium]NIR09961.1 lactate utilization protein [Candidatus Aminicenantes bacterium]NIT27453.1 lactate utilization protein [Candidatus Aminicenantes bacterium]